MNSENGRVQLITPIVFNESITSKSLIDLLFELTRRAPYGDETIDVIFSSLGGEIDHTFVFSAFMERFDRKQNVRALAVGQVASAGIAMFLGFPRRASAPTARFRFHKVSVHMPLASKSTLRSYFEIVEHQIVKSVSDSTNLDMNTVREYMDKDVVISDHAELYRTGIINEPDHNQLISNRQ